MPDNDQSHLVLIGGQSGVGKTSVAAEMHARLGESGVKHAVIEGDALDFAWPAPWEHELAERNLAAVWKNYRELGYRKLIYTNTVSVLQRRVLAAAMGGDPMVTAILLQCDHQTAEQRLGQREIGSQLQAHIERSAARAQQLEREAPGDVLRIGTDGRTVGEIADEILKRIGWISADKDVNND